jgi:hypothetical protein
VVIFTDAQAALARIQHNRMGAGQAMASRTIRLDEQLHELGLKVEYRWVPGHAGIEGNEVADGKAKEAAKLQHISARAEGRSSAQAAMDPTRESPTVASRPEAYNTTIAFLKRRVTEAKWRDSARWIKDRVDRQRMRTYILSQRQTPDPLPAHTRKGIATRFYQLKTGHALIGTYLHWRTLRADNICWWCAENTPQNLHHLFKRCPRWQDQQRTLWRDVQEATKDKRAATERSPMPKVFADWRCSKAILDFLAHTEVGRTVPRALVQAQGG